MAINWGRALMEGTSGAVSGRRDLAIAERLKKEADARDLAMRQTLAGEAFGRQESLLDRSESRADERYRRGREDAAADLEDSLYRESMGKVREAGIPPPPGATKAELDALYTERVGVDRERELEFQKQDREIAEATAGLRERLMRVQIGNAERQRRALDLSDPVQQQQQADADRRFAIQQRLVAAKQEQLDALSQIAMTTDAQKEQITTLVNEIDTITTAMETQLSQELAPPPPEPGGDGGVLRIDEIGGTPGTGFVDPSMEARQANLGGLQWAPTPHVKTPIGKLRQLVSDQYTKRD